MLTRRDFIKMIGALGIFQIFNTVGLSNLRPPNLQAGYPNILILVLDTLTASRMSLFGCDRKTTPHMARFSSRANVYHRHYANGNFTSPGTASLLTGTYPWSHRSINMFGSVLDDIAQNNLFELLPPEYFKITYTQNFLVKVLLEQFQRSIDKLFPVTEVNLQTDTVTRWLQRDFKSAFWSETIIRPQNTAVFSPTLLFLSFVDKFQKIVNKMILEENLIESYPRGIATNDRGLSFLLEDTIDWLKKQISSYQQPFFSYIHLWPSHEPYCPHKDYINIFPNDETFTNKPEHFFSIGVSNDELRQLRTHYDEYVAYVDAELGRLLTHLEQKNILDNTILIITSDHGQAFERGIHGHVTPVLYESLIHIPLLISVPGQTQRRDFHTATSAVDILPTILKTINQPIPDWCEGKILPGFSDSDHETCKTIYSVEAKENSKFGSLQKASFAMIQGDYKLIRYIGYEGYNDKSECYNLADDPDELNNLYPSQSISRDLKDELDEKINEVNQLFLNHQP